MMQIRLLKDWNGMQAGRELDMGRGVAELLIARKLAVSLDPDDDGRAEGGRRGSNKAFSRPPRRKSNG